ncbi:hypothetical protein E4U43_005707 [Claviceps pusilla]|uniref:Uncharacterized protein n=1 Tax=Claviceps pusilla TaxID=123648 RepID=A0A9P7NIY6_9HYPO|nr:hypothetical protein E4U43_005707 [Claviceps pusilla]
MSLADVLVIDTDRVCDESRRRGSADRDQRYPMSGFNVGYCNQVCRVEQQDGQTRSADRQIPCPQTRSSRWTVLGSDKTQDWFEINRLSDLERPIDRSPAIRAAAPLQLWREELKARAYISDALSSVWRS